MKKLVLAGALAGVVPLLTTTVAAQGAPRFAPTYANCTAMHKDFPHGVGLVGAHDHTSGVPVTNFARRPKIYRANTKSDADHDHIACEAH
jgi:hypothetical protein